MCILRATAFTLPVQATSSSPEGFVLKAQTKHFAFYARRDQQADPAGCERYLSELERLFRHDVPHRTRYYRYRSAQELAAFTGTYAAGMTFVQAREIHSTEAFHAHEIVHLVAGQLGRPGAFFHEGLAVALGNGSRWRGRDVDALARERAGRLSVSWMVEHFERMEPDVAYPLAGSFVGALLREYGGARLANFFRACATAGADREAAFARTFGQPLKEAGAAWLSALSAPGRRSARKPRRVTESELKQGGMAWSRCSA